MAKIKKGKTKAAKPLGKKAMAKAIEIVEEYLANGRNGKQAYLKVYPHVKDSTAGAEAHVLLNKPEVSVMLQQREEELRVQRPLGSLRPLAFGAISISASRNCARAGFCAYSKA